MVIFIKVKVYFRSFIILIMFLVEQIIFIVVNLFELNYYVLFLVFFLLQIFCGLQSFFYIGSILYLFCLFVDGMEVVDDFLQIWMDIYYKVRQ